ncbi:hypothetical protein FOTG_18421 [Fusarium oxysporum f. sp. vasinfectum 25433]|uniref:Uncharacterized protein n=1 Tax=Fusarium oxysporum f. sp. vasinfectum 25433 TaxID=1089449 RepID=X0KWF0_FUSOX|nr:hypothetical protein FOTG_18421 [Fusarium oxysporum f. sp. vasinfectum 25433]
MVGHSAKCGSIPPYEKHGLRVSQRLNSSFLKRRHGIMAITWRNFWNVCYSSSTFVVAKLPGRWSCLPYGTEIPPTVAYETSSTIAG